MRKGVHFAASGVVLAILSGSAFAQDSSPGRPSVDRPDRGDRIERRFDRRGDAVDRRLDRVARRAHDADRDAVARHLNRVGDRIDRRLDRQGRQLDRRFDRRDRRGAR